MSDQAVPDPDGMSPTALRRPEVTPPGPWAFPDPTSDWTLDNGLRVLAYDVPGQYVISASLVVPLPLSPVSYTHLTLPTICSV